MNPVNFDNKVSVREAYLIMFDYLEKYWQRGGKPDDISNLLSGLALWDTEKGKEPMDAAVFSDWLESAITVLEKEQSKKGYRDADIKLSKG